VILALGLLIIGVAVYAILRRAEVRLVLLLAALTLGVVAGRADAILQRFFTTLTAPEYVVPICSAMGFAYVLRQTGCDQHLVHLLVRPLRSARAFLIPGLALIGFLVNIPVISQTSSAVAIGSVMIPLLVAARVSRVTTGAALLLGVSIGGELLNPGAPEYRSIIKEAGLLGLAVPTGARCVQAMLPLILLHLAVATGLFWVLSLRAEARHLKEQLQYEALEPEPPHPPFQVSLVKAAVPLVPLILLFLAAPPLELLSVPKSWLVGAKEPELLFDSRLIGTAMLVGVAAAALTDRRAAWTVVGTFFEGTGYALTHIISIIVAAACFGEGVKGIGLDRVVAGALHAWPHLLMPAAGFLPLGFGAISGSGTAATQSLFGIFAAPAVTQGIAAEHVGAVVALGAAAGRTMSMVAAVALMCATLTETKPTELVRRVAGPLLIGVLVVTIMNMVVTAGRRPELSSERPPTVSSPQTLPSARRWQPATDECVRVQRSMTPLVV
jgi:DcuC family C4-dicarboxylate transporter